MRQIFRLVCCLMAISLLLCGCQGIGGQGASTPAPSQSVTPPAAQRTTGRFETVGYYAYQGATQANIDFWVACGIDTIQLLDIGWYFNPTYERFDQYYQGLASEITAAQQKGIRVYVILLTNLEQWKGDAVAGNGSGKAFDPADTVMMQERLSYIEHAIQMCAHADGFTLFAGDPGGVTGLSVPGGLSYYVQMGKDVQALVKKYAPHAEYNLNLWALAQYVQSTAYPNTLAFWQGETQHARELIAMQDLFGSEIGVEIPGHDYYRALALRLYAQNNAYPAQKFPTATDIGALEAKNTTRIWAFSHFLLDELDDGDSAGTSRTTLPSFNTRYIYKYLNGIRDAGMNGAIAGNSTLNNAVNLYAFARMASDETATPETVLREYASFVATPETAETLFEIFKFLENDANWHQKLPEQDREPLFETAITSVEQAYRMFQTVQAQTDPTFSLPESPQSYLKKIGDRILMMMPAKHTVSYPYYKGGSEYLALYHYYSLEEDPRDGFYMDGRVELQGEYAVYTTSLKRTVDLSDVRIDGGKLYINIYAEKATAKSVGYFQMTDKADKLATENTFHMTLPALQQGWNQVEVPISEGTVVGSAIQNWSKIAAYRIVLFGQAGDAYYLSDLYFQ